MRCKKSKLFLIFILSMFLLSSINVYGLKITDEINKNSVIATSDLTVDAGRIKIIYDADDITDSFVECIPVDNFEIEIPEEGSTVTFQVDYELECPGTVDWCRASIKFSDDSDSDYFEYDKTDNKKGTLEISKLVMPGDIVSIYLKAMLTDLLGFTEVAQHKAISFTSSLKRYANPQQTGYVFVDENGGITTMVSSPYSDDRALIYDYPPEGGVAVWYVNYGLAMNPEYPITVSLEFKNDIGESQTMQFTTKTVTDGKLRIAAYVEPGQKINIIKKVKFYHKSQDQYVEKVDTSYWAVDPYEYAKLFEVYTSPETSKPGQEMTFHYRVDCTIWPIYVKLDWGDGTESDWVETGGYGMPLKLHHTYSEKDEYTIKYSCKDGYNISGESGEITHSVKGIKSKSLPALQTILQRLAIQLPILQRLLKF